MASGTMDGWCHPSHLALAQLCHGLSLPLWTMRCTDSHAAARQSERGKRGSQPHKWSSSVAAGALIAALLYFSIKHHYSFHLSFLFGRNGGRWFIQGFWIMLLQVLTCCFSSCSSQTAAWNIVAPERETNLRPVITITMLPLRLFFPRRLRAVCYGTLEIGWGSPPRLGSHSELCEATEVEAECVKSPWKWKQ